MNMPEAQEYLNGIHAEMLRRANLGHSNIDSSGCLQIMHQHEGTVLFYESAFAVKKDEYIFIITEHHGSIVYHEEEVVVRQYTRIWEEVKETFPWDR